MSDFDPKPLLRYIYDTLCTTDARNRRMSFTSDKIYNDTMKDAATTDDIFLSVEVPSETRQVRDFNFGLTLKVDALPLPDNLPAGRGMMRVRRHSAREGIVTTTYLIPLGDSKPKDWREITADGALSDSGTFHDLWHGATQVYNHGPSAPPFGTIVYPHDKPKPIFN